MPRRASSEGQGHVMKLGRRTFLQLAGAALAAPAFSHLASAQQYPARPVRIIAGFAAGGGVDITARLIGQWLARPARPALRRREPRRRRRQYRHRGRRQRGARRLHAAARHRAQCGQRLALRQAQFQFQSRHRTRRRHHPRADGGRWCILRCRRNAAEFIAYAKANPGKINMASAGIGSAPHMAGELFKMMAGVDMVHVPYRGQGPALTDLLGGQVQVLFAAAPGTADHVKTGKLRALAVTTAARSPDAAGGADRGGFRGGLRSQPVVRLRRAANTPADIVDKLNREINAAIADGGMKARLAAIGGDPMPGPARRVRQADRGRNRKMGQGGPRRRYQAGLGGHDVMIGRLIDQSACGRVMPRPRR